MAEKGIVSVETRDDNLEIELENGFGLTFSAEGLVIRHRNSEDVVQLSWPAADRVCNLSRGCKVIYASGDTPVLREV